MSAQTYACGSAHRPIRLCLHVFVFFRMSMWVRANDCDSGFFHLGTSLHLSHYVGIVAIRLGRAVSAIATLGGRGGGLAAPSPREWLPGQEGCSFSSFTPAPSSAPSPSAPPIQVVPDHLPPTLLPEPSLPPPPLPSLPTLPLPPARGASCMEGLSAPRLLCGPALMPCLFPSRWEQVLCVGSKPAQTRGLYNQQAALKVLCHALELPQ